MLALTRPPLRLPSPPPPSSQALRIRAFTQAVPCPCNDLHPLSSKCQLTPGSTQHHPIKQLLVRPFPPPTAAHRSLLCSKAICGHAPGCPAQGPRALRTGHAEDREGEGAWGGPLPAMSIISTHPHAGRCTATARRPAAGDSGKRMS